MTTVVSTASELIAAAKRPGLITLSGVIEHAVLKAPKDITIKALKGAVLKGLDVRDGVNVTLDGLEIVAGQYGLALYRCTKVRARKLRVHGNRQSSTGIHVRQSTDVQITSSELFDLWHGIEHLDCLKLTVSYSRFHDLRCDGVRGGGSNKVAIYKNGFRDHHPITDGPHPDHADAVQFWTTNTTKSAEQITVTHNTYDRGAGKPAQGVFLRDQLGGLPFLKVRIEDNAIRGAMANGIGVNGAHSPTIRGNLIEEAPDQRSNLNLVNITGKLVLKGNRAPLYQREGKNLKTPPEGNH